MKKITLLVTLVFAIQFANSQQTCSTALPITTAGLYVVDAVNGTEVPAPICTINGSGATAGEWYLYTPSQNFTVTVTTDMPVNTNKDTRFHVYTGTCGNLTCYSGDDDSGDVNGDFLSLATFNVTAGTSYYIAFDNRWSSVGFTFELIENPFVEPPVVPITFSSQTLNSINSTYNICVVDMNGDYLDDIVGVSSNAIKIHTQNEDGTFAATTYNTTFAANLPSWSLAAGDYNKDGYNDLMYGGGQGVTLMKSNGAGTAYTNVTPGQYVFCQRTNFIDVDNDGNLDAFTCHDVDPNVYYLNDGSSAANLTYYQSGVTAGSVLLGVHPEGGNYGTVWIDYDNDGDSDLFIAKCRGGASTAKYNELHKNNGDGTFTDVSVAANMYDPLQTWSSAWADYDNDGDMDALVGASSITDGSHKLMINNGDGTFSNGTLGSGWDTNTSTNIEHIAYDFDNDGFVDVMGGGDKIMLNQGDMKFAPITVGFGVCAVGDLNNDGFLDFQSGSTLKINSGNTNNWVKVNLLGTFSNANGIGARVEIYGDWGKQIRDVRSGEGFKYMSSLNAHFGIGTATAISRLVVRWPSGKVDEILNPAINQSVLVVEGTNVLANNEFVNSEFSIYPNPVDDSMTIKVNNSSTQIVSAQIVDLIGKVVMKPIITSNTIDVKSLASGTYVLVLKDKDGKQSSEKFLKN